MSKAMSFRAARFTPYVCLLLSAVGCSRDADQPDTEHVAVAKQSLLVNEWPIEALVATNSIYFEERAKFEGLVAVTSASPGPVLSSNAELTLNVSSILTGSVKADSLVLKSSSKITGDATYNSLSNAGTIQGIASSPLALPLSIVVPALPAITPGSTDVTLVASQSTTLAAGSYDDILLNSGNSNIATKLTLSGGLYQFDTVTLQNDARIECAAACEIRVNGRASVGQRSFIGPKVVAGVGPGNVQLLVKGTNGASGPLGTPPAVLLDHDSQLQAYALVPNGTLRLGHRVKLRGKFVARDALVGADADAKGLQLPLITQGPEGDEVREGTTVSFSVTATGTAPLSYQWQRNGVNVLGATSATFPPFAAQLTDDQASYRVVISNVAGSVVSNAAILTVLPCEDLDLLCDGEDEDCDGDIDEDFPPSCEGSSILLCTGGETETEPCDDGMLCDGVETCELGLCIPGTPFSEDDGNTCTEDLCSELSGPIHQPLPAGANCGDADACNGLHQCDSMANCVETPVVVDDANPCTVDSCDPNTGPAHVPVATGTACSDGDASNGSEVCSAAGLCVADGPVPEVLCVQQVGPGQLVASFGYANPSSVVVTIPPGAANFLSPPPAEPATLPSAFAAAGAARAFTARFSGNQTLTWTVGGRSATASSASSACSGAVARGVESHAESPGELRTTAGRPPAYRFTGSRRFRSRGFDPLPGDAVDVPPMPPQEEAFQSADFGSTLTVEFLDPVPLLDGCPIAPRVELFADDVAQGVFPDFPTCTPPCTPFSEPFQVPLTFAPLPGRDSVMLGVRVIDTGCGFPDPLFSVQNEVPLVPHPGPGPLVCSFYEDSSVVDGFCWQDRDVANIPPPSAPTSRLCFELTTSFVDEGGDVFGAPVFCTTDADCGGSRCENGACAMQQRYPARFAEYQLELVAPNGTRRLGRYYDQSGADTGTGVVRYLDADGCIAPGLLPSYFLLHEEGAALTLKARVRSRLQDAYDIRYGDVLGDNTYEVIQFSEAELGIATWPIRPGTSLREAPPVVTLTSQTLSPASNVTAALGTLLVNPDNGHPGTPLAVSIGTGAEVCELGNTCSDTSPCPGPQECKPAKRCGMGGNFCETDADCFGVPCWDEGRCSITGGSCFGSQVGNSCPLNCTAGVECDTSADCATGDVCQVDRDSSYCQISGEPGCVYLPDNPDGSCGLGNGPCVTVSRCRTCSDAGICEGLPARCHYCSLDSVYEGAIDLLSVGPARAPLEATTCTVDAECPENQLCTLPDGSPCPGGACYCHWPDQSRWRNVTIHEAGHQLQQHGIGSLGGQSEYFFNCAGGDCEQPKAFDSTLLLDPEGIAPMCSCDQVGNANGWHCLQSAERFASALGEGFAHFNAARTFNRKTDPQTGTPETDCSFHYYKEFLGATDDYCEFAPGLCRSDQFLARDGLLYNIALPPLETNCEAGTAWRNVFCPSALPNDDIRFLSTELDFLRFFWEVYAVGPRVTTGELNDIFKSACNATACNGACAPCADQAPVWAPTTDASQMSLLTGAQLFFGTDSARFDAFVAAANAAGITPDSIPP
jgi:hypothetical protein